MSVLYTRSPLYTNVETLLRHIRFVQGSIIFVLVLIIAFVIAFIFDSSLLRAAPSSSERQKEQMAVVGVATVCLVPVIGLTMSLLALRQASRWVRVTGEVSGTTLMVGVDSAHSIRVRLRDAEIALPSTWPFAYFHPLDKAVWLRSKTASVMLFPELLRDEASFAHAWERAGRSLVSYRPHQLRSVTETLKGTTHL